MIPGIVPAIRKKSAPDPGDGFNCTLTAGVSGAGSSHGVGYAVNWETVTFGSIDRQPIPGQTMYLFLAPHYAWDVIVAFHGDIMSIVGSLGVWVDGIKLDGGSGWLLDGVYTIQIWGTNDLRFVENQEYFIEFK